MSETSHLVEQHGGSPRTTVEMLATVLIAVGALLTAWAAFQHAKWSGVQASHFREAAAAGTAASQATTVSSLNQNVDVGAFLQWLQAVRDDIDAGRVDVSKSPYTPDPQTLSGFIALRFRSEFVPAFDAWLASRPLVNAGAPSTPFAMPEYSLTAQRDADRFNAEAQERGAQAQEAVHRAENYALTTVLFAVAMVMATIGAKLGSKAVSWLAVGFAFAILITAAIVMATFPVEV